MTDQQEDEEFCSYDSSSSTKFSNMKLWLSRNFWIILGVASLVMIFVLKFTDWRLFSCSKAEAWNSCFENFAFGIIAAAIFYVANVKMPNWLYRKAVRLRIENELSKISLDIKRIINSVQPYRMDFKERDRDFFVKAFEDQNLNEPFSFNRTVSFKDRINEIQSEIISICEGLFLNYFKFMSNAEITYLYDILNSYFIREVLCPIEYDYPEQYWFNSYNNQRKMGESIFYLYELPFPHQTHKGIPVLKQVMGFLKKTTRKSNN